MHNLQVECTQHYKDAQADYKCENDCINGLLIYLDQEGYMQQAPCVKHHEQELLINLEGY